MKKIVIMLVILSCLVTSTVVFSKPIKHSPTYQCKNLGKQKVKPFKFNTPKKDTKFIKHKFYYTKTIKSNPKYRNA